MDLYTPLYRNLLLPLWEGLRRRPTLDRLRYLQQTEWRSTDELIALQVGALRRLLAHAHDRSPAYRRRIEAAGFHPAQLRDLEDLQRLPLLSRELMRGEPGELRAPMPGEVLVRKSTSGTTGEPFRFAYNYDSEVWRQAVKLRAYGWAGWVPGARTVHYWGPSAVAMDGKKAAKVKLDRALRREVYIDCAKQSEADLEQAVAVLRRLRPRCLVGFTQATVELAKFVLRKDRRDWPAMQVVCGAERLYPDDRVLLEQAFGRPGTVFETYGCREFMLMASECEAHEGLHQSMQNLVIEIVDEKGRAVPAGATGQVAITDLHNLSMPLVRYLTGDLAVALPTGARCSCGRGLSRLRSVEGRQSDLLRGADGRGIPGLIFNSIFAALGGKVQQFQAIQRRDGHIDLKVVPGPEFDDQVLAGVKTRLHPYFGDLPMSVDLVQIIPPLPSGKRKYIIVER